MEISRVSPMCKSGKATWTHIGDGRDRTWRTPAVPGSVSGAPPPGERRMHQEFPGVQSGRHHIPAHPPTPSMDLWIHRVPRAGVKGEKVTTTERDKQWRPPLLSSSGQAHRKCWVQPTPSGLDPPPRHLERDTPWGLESTRHVTSREGYAPDIDPRPPGPRKDPRTERRQPEPPHGYHPRADTLQKV